jgi:hypothetical protein
MHYRKIGTGKKRLKCTRIAHSKNNKQNQQERNHKRPKRYKTNKTNKNVPRGTLKKKGGAKHQPQSFPSKLNPPFLSHRERQPSQTYFDALRGLSHGHSRLAIYVALNRNSYIAGAGT